MSSLENPRLQSGSMKHLLAIIALSVIGLALAFGQGIGGRAAIGGRAGVGGGPSGGGPVVFVQQSTSGNDCNTAVASCTITLSSSVGAGHLIVVPYGLYSGGSSSTVSSVTDTASNSYTVVDYDVTLVGSQQHFGFAYAVATTGGFTVITVNYPPSAAISAHGMEFSGNASSSVFDTSSTNTGAASTTASTASLTPNNANEMFLGVDGANNVPTQTISSSGWTTCGFGNGNGLGAIGCGYIIITGSAAQQGTWTLGSSQAWGNIIGAFKP